MSSQCEQIDNFHRVNDKIATAGQPTTGQFKDIAAEGFDTVFNLAKHNEGTEVKKLGMQYVHVPVDFRAPTPEDLEVFFKHMDMHKNKKLFIHCGRNWRASTFLFLYDVIKANVPIAEARKHMEAVWSPFPAWQDFIDQSFKTYGIQAD